MIYETKLPAEAERRSGSLWSLVCSPQQPDPWGIENINQESEDGANISGQTCRLCLTRPSNSKLKPSFLQLSPFVNERGAIEEDS